MPTEEPSILDFLKSRLKFWRKEEKIAIPPESASKTRGVIRVKEAPPAPARAGQTKPAAPHKPIPWRSLLALALALIGQRAFEMPTRQVLPGTILYFLGLAFLVWAILCKEWRLA